MKPFWQSKTLIVNFIAALVACLLALQGTDLITGNPQLVAWTATFLAVCNIVLRLLTGQSIMGAFKGKL